MLQKRRDLDEPAVFNRVPLDKAEPFKLAKDQINIYRVKREQLSFYALSPVLKPSLAISQCP